MLRSICFERPTSTDHATDQNNQTYARAAIHLFNVRKHHDHHHGTIAIIMKTVVSCKSDNFIGFAYIYALPSIVSKSVVLKGNNSVPSDLRLCSGIADKTPKKNRYLTNRPLL